MNHYMPRLCGTCPHFRRDLPDSRRKDPRQLDPLGRCPGWCAKLVTRTTRTSWCQVPEERAQQLAAMGEYREYPRRGVGTGARITIRSAEWVMKSEEAHE